MRTGSTHHLTEGDAELQKGLVEAGSLGLAAPEENNRARVVPGTGAALLDRLAAIPCEQGPGQARVRVRASHTGTPCPPLSKLT